LNRPGDIAARYGGEELALLLPGTTHAGAMALAERITQAVRDLGIVHAGSQHGIVTISAGVESLVPARDLDQPPALVEHADLALYAAKRAGRDRVFSYADLYGSAPAAREPRMVRA
jgi:diguanylate cyclase (GGDEF)-like protein